MAKSRKPCVLIVDDEEATRTSYGETFKNHEPDWEVLLAESKAQGLEIVERRNQQGSPIQVVLTDLKMGGDDKAGIRLIQAIRKADPLLVSVLFTGVYSDTKDLLKEAADLGAFDVMSKSSQMSPAERLLEKTRTALRFREFVGQMQSMARFFDPQVYEMLRRNQELLTPARRWITIVFWDIRGFSALCAVLKEYPRVIADFLKAYSDLAEQVISGTGGVLDKFIGDGVMALYGVDVADGDEEGQANAALNAVKAAKQFLAGFRDLRRRTEGQFRKKTVDATPTIGLGCGINSYDAIVGDLGTETRGQFTAIGPHVNFAQRLESHAKEEPILISQTTNEAVKDKVVTRYFTTLEDVKNIPGRFKVFSVVVDSED